MKYTYKNEQSSLINYDLLPIELGAILNKIKNEDHKMQALVSMISWTSSCTKPNLVYFDGEQHIIPHFAPTMIAKQGEHEFISLFNNCVQSQLNEVVDYPDYTYNNSTYEYFNEGGHFINLDELLPYEIRYDGGFLMKLGNYKFHMIGARNIAEDNYKSIIDNMTESYPCYINSNDDLIKGYGKGASYDINTTNGVEYDPKNGLTENLFNNELSDFMHFLTVDFEESIPNFVDFKLTEEQLLYLDSFYPSLKDDNRVTCIKLAMNLTAWKNKVNRYCNISNSLDYASITCDQESLEVVVQIAEKLKNPINAMALKACA